MKFTIFRCFRLDILPVSVGFGGGAGATFPEVAASARSTSGSRTVGGTSRRSSTNSKYARGSSPGSNGGNGLWRDSVK
jgi:hypothetical protein